MKKLEALGIYKSYDNVPIIEDINITVYENEMVCLLGASGIGKTTLFNILSGLEYPTKGKVFLDVQDITGIPGHISYMQQKNLLLPYKTTLDNVALPLLIRGYSKKEAREKAQGYFEDFLLTGSEKKYPCQLSGGMRQRAALLRTYLFSKNIMLLDEPFSKLDTITKSHMHTWYLNVREKLKSTTLFITHDIDEAILLSDRIYILSGKPATLTTEIKISTKEKRNEAFTTSETFIKYKKEILAHIHIAN